MSVPPVSESLCSSPSHYHKRVLSGMWVGRIQLLQPLQFLRVFRACSVISECFGDVIAFTWQRDSGMCKGCLWGKKKQGASFTAVGKHQVCLALWWSSRIFCSSLQVLVSFTPLKSAVNLAHQVACRNSAFGLRVPGGAGRCADSSQPFSLY